MGELVEVEGKPHLKLTSQDFTSLIVARLAELSGAGFDPSFQVDHDFCDGIYARTLTLKKGQVVIGAPHSTESFLLVRQGHTLVANGYEILNVKAGFQTVLGVGKMCLCFAVEDTVFTNYSPNPDNLKEQDDLWALNTFAIDDSMWHTVDSAIEEMLQGLVAKQGDTKCLGD
jgi:hypothetical protein